MKYNPCSHGNYNLAKNGDITHMINIIEWSKVLGKHITKTLT